MNRVVLQIPVSPSLRNEAEREAEKQGFSSLQDAVRLFLHKLAKEEVQIRIQEQFPPVKLSQKAIRRYNKMDRDIASGKIKLKSFNSVEELMRDLNS